MPNFKPHYVYLLITFFLVIYLIAIIRNKEWVLFSGNGKYNFDFFIKHVGRAAVRIFIGFLTVLGIGASFSAFYYHQNKNNNNTVVTNVKEHSEGLISQFNTFISQNPQYSYLIVASGFGIVFLGFLFKVSWLTNPQGNYKMVWLQNIFGAKIMRMVMLIATGAATILSLVQFFN